MECHYQAAGTNICTKHRLEFPRSKQEILPALIESESAKNSQMKTDKLAMASQTVVGNKSVRCDNPSNPNSSMTNKEHQGVKKNTIDWKGSRKDAEIKGKNVAREEVGRDYGIGGNRGGDFHKIIFSRTVKEKTFMLTVLFLQKQKVHVWYRHTFCWSNKTAAHFTGSDSLAFLEIKGTQK